MPKRLLGAAARFVTGMVGGDVTEIEAVESIGTTASQILGNDPERVTVLLVNLSANTIFFSFGPDVSTGRGVRLAANGGQASYNIRTDMMLPIREVHAVAGGAASDLYVLTARRITVDPEANAVGVQA